MKKLFFGEKDPANIYPLSIYPQTH